MDTKRNDDLRDNNQDQLRGNTMNEQIREVGNNRDLSSDDRRDADTERNMEEGSEENTSANTTRRGMNYTPQDMSGVRSGGITDMDDQAEGGAGSVSGRRLGAGSNITQKLGTTGSDFDGQVSTS